jgi:threonine dehydratase
VTEFNYRISDPETAHVYVGLQIRSEPEIEKLAGHFRKEGFPTLDLTGNEMAKTHLRYMVGGRSGLARNEVLYRFEFPERPGALVKFLGAMNPDWNISLFHYRNQGDDYGRILVGIQVPPEDKKVFKDFLATLGYPYWSETDNPAYRLFL